jgi:hypothetical protein
MVFVADMCAFALSMVLQHNKFLNGEKSWWLLDHVLTNQNA